MPDHSLDLHGQHTVLQPIRQKHIASLWKNLDIDTYPDLIGYLPHFAPNDEEELWNALEHLRADRGFMVFAVLADPDNLNPGTSFSPSQTPSENGGVQVLGIIAYLNISTLNRELEIVCHYKAFAASARDF